VPPCAADAGYDVTCDEFDGPHRVLPATARHVLDWLNDDDGRASADPAR